MPRKKQKIKLLMASLDIDDELLTCHQYKVISEREDDEGTEQYTVVNENGEQKEYPEYYFDSECK